ncbi:hypothetical protein L6452_18396 [Arctium lappa]|uniref:Uncharacterized protein n=1 Tax=Arctium lappa TaxID=4217 RepID=A0ACB9C642_ARCLA|nr:hypothetical protein L6452_18396 [Arctium lappa]
MDFVDTRLELFIFPLLENKGIWLEDDGCNDYRIEDSVLDKWLWLDVEDYSRPRWKDKNLCYSVHFLLTLQPKKTLGVLD